MELPEEDLDLLGAGRHSGLAYRGFEGVQVAVTLGRSAQFAVMF